MKYKSELLYSVFVFLLLSCDPLVTEFSSNESPKEYTAKPWLLPQ